MTEKDLERRRRAAPIEAGQEASTSQLGSAEWQVDCLRWRGAVLTGQHGHWCPDWDYLPIDETSREWPCPCSASDGWQGPVLETAETTTELTSVCVFGGALNASEEQAERSEDAQ